MVRDATQHLQPSDCATFIGVHIVIRVLLVKVFTALRALHARVTLVQQIPDIVRVEATVLLSQWPCRTFHLCQYNWV